MWGEIKKKSERKGLGQIGKHPLRVGRNYNSNLTWKIQGRRGKKKLGD